jgi:hypothetical protein
MTGDSLAWALSILGVAATVAVGYLSYRLSKKEPRPVYVVAGNILVKGDPTKDIEVRYKERPVPLATSTIIGFWNAGREPIRRADLVESHPLRIILDQKSEILDARIGAVTRPDLDFRCSADTKSSSVDFDFSFLNHHDGATIEILHTCSNPFSVGIEGTIIGINGPPQRIRSPLWDDPRKFSSPWFWGMMIFVLSLLGFTLVRVWQNAKGLGNTAFAAGMTLAIVGFLAWSAIDAWRRDGRRVPAPLRANLGPQMTLEIRTPDMW